MTLLQGMTNLQLDRRIKFYYAKEREALTEVLITLKEIAARKMYLSMGRATLFEYLTLDVGYPKNTAHRRLDAVGLMIDIPSLTDQLKSGEVSLNQVCLVQKAAREVAKRTKKQVSAADKAEIFAAITNKDERLAQQQVASFFDIPVIKHTIKKVQADRSVRYEFTLSKEQEAQVQRAQELCSHSLFDQDIATYIHYFTERIIKQKTSVRADKGGLDKVVKNDLEPNNIRPLKKGPGKTSAEAPQVRTKFSASAQPTSSAKNSSPAQDQASLSVDSLSVERIHLDDGPLARAHCAKPARGFSARQRKIILNRQGCCQFVDPKTRQKCGNRWHLQADHRQAKWAGGESTLENGQALCARHNREKYRRETGLRSMS